MAGPYSPNTDLRSVSVVLEDGATVSTMKDSEDRLFREQSLEFQREILNMLKIIAQQLTHITEEEFIQSNEIGDI